MEYMELLLQLCQPCVDTLKLPQYLIQFLKLFLA